MKKTVQFLIVIFFTLASRAQDPAYAQFFSSPLTINPALTANINEKWRMVTNYRNQWSGTGDPYTTATVSMDSKLFQDVAGNYVDENTRVGIGGMMMMDRSVGGALKSNYASLNMTANIRLMKKEGYEANGARIRHIDKAGNDEGAEQRLGVGLGISYGHRRLDYSKLSFGEQFNGTTFDTNLPSGEGALSQMKGFMSASAGLLYTYRQNYTQIDIGVAGYHLNKPMQTFVNDKNQELARRYVVHANMETLLGNSVLFAMNGIYQNQAAASYFSVGGTFGYILPSYNSESDFVLNAGAWYWAQNAIIPYLGISYGKFQVGLSYDITTSQLNEAARRSNTFEFSLVLRGVGTGSGVIPAPWK